MANKITQKKNLDYENIKEEDIMGEVDITINKDAFKVPKKCHMIKLNKFYKKIKVGNLESNYYVLRCPICKREYLDSGEVKKLEKIWLLEKKLQEKAIEVKRKINFDGKTFFLRFPKEITKKWHKGAIADIKILNSDEFIVKINN